VDRVSQLNAIFFPRALAVIGVSPNPDTFGSRFLKALIDFGFKGKLYPVNPKGGEIFGLKIYPTVFDLPEEADSADIMVPAPLVPQVLQECLEAGIKGAQIYSSGFAETGDADRIALQEEVKAIAKKGIRVIGPNCFGVYCPAGGHTLLPGGDFPKESGPVGFISQSGGHAVELGRQARGRGLRFSKAVSYGNAIDVNEADLLEYMAQDPETKVITMYLEGPRQGRRFFDLVQKTAPKKPIVIWKAGLTEAGARAVRSHTGSLGGEGAIWRALFQQTAAIPVGSLEELADTAEALLILPKKTGRQLGVIGGGGGTSVAATDACAAVGLRIPPFDDSIRSKLAEILPMAGTMMRNPVDVGVPLVQPEMFRRTMDTVAAVEAVQTIIATQPLFYLLGGHFDMGPRDQIVQALIEVPVGVRDRFGKPVVIVLPPGGEEVEMTEAEKGRRQARDKYREMGILALPSLERVAKAVANVVTYYEKTNAAG
jgi:acyl-CoA synthetase (NDP forming)